MISEYTEWLKKEISFERIGEYYEITTPYLDNAHDYIQMYVKQQGQEVFFTDDGAIINGLKMCGFQFTPNRRKYLEQILFQYGIKLQGNELTAKAPIGAFPQKKHMFVQAMLRVDDMFTITRSRVSSFFTEDIQTFFEEKDIFSTENVQFTGISGFSHNYDFLLQRSRTKPERLCRAVNNPDRASMGTILFAWNDTKPSRRDDSQLIVFLNDQDNVAKGVEDAYTNYNVHVIRWSEREQENNLSILSAS